MDVGKNNSDSKAHANLTRVGKWNVTLEGHEMLVILRRRGR